MNDELLMLDAALFQLRSALGDDPAAMQVRIGTNILANALDAAKDGPINAARVSDIEFALNDLIAMIDDCGAPDSVFPIISMLQSDVARLRNQTALSAATIGAIRELQTKLRTRRTAIERNTFRAEDSPEATLPHPPEELRAAAMSLRETLSAAGFATPALDELIDDPATVRFHHLNEIADELDTIAGGG